jgi:hypothetical protein
MLKQISTLKSEDFVEKFDFYSNTKVISRVDYDRMLTLTQTERSAEVSSCTCFHLDAVLLISQQVNKILESVQADIAVLKTPIPFILKYVTPHITLSTECLEFILKPGVASVAVRFEFIFLF